MPPTTIRSPSLALELALLGILATLWGASYTFIRVGVETIPPVTFIAARTLIAGLLLLLVMRVRGIALPRDRGLWRSFLVQACLNSVVPLHLDRLGRDDRRCRPRHHPQLDLADLHLPACRPAGAA